MSSSNGHPPEDGWQGTKVCRGIRGATTVEENSREVILERTRELLMGMILLNGIQAEDVASAIFTTTLDLNAEYPAVAARQLGWHDVPLLCAHEMNVPHGLPRCLRILIMWNTTRPPEAIRHVYIRDATTLRPDRSIEMPDLINQINAELTRIDNQAH